MLVIDKCKERKSELKMSNLQIAQKSGIPLSTVNSFFAEIVKNPTLLTVGPICAALGVSLDGLFGIVNEDMNAAEIKRITEEYQQNEAELNKRIEAHASQLALSDDRLAQATDKNKQLEAHIADLHDRIVYQKKAIRMHRIAIVAITACAAVLAVLAFV